MYRDENQNQSLSRLIGPPPEALRSQFLFTSFGVVKPAAFSSGVKLLLARPPLVKVKKLATAKRLPPSRGMKLIRTPPVGSSADTAVWSTVTSAAEPTSGIWPPMLPPACGV